MKRVEESILSRDYKKHIQAGGSTPGSFSFSNLRGGQGPGNRKGQALFKARARPDTLTFTRAWKKQGPRVTEGAGKAEREA